MEHKPKHLNTIRNFIMIDRLVEQIFEMNLYPNNSEENHLNSNLNLHIDIKYKIALKFNI